MTALLLLACLWQSDELVRQFLEGRADARERLVGRGVFAISDLLEARKKADDKSRRAISDLLFEIKKSALEETDEPGRAVLKKLEDSKTTIDFHVLSAADFLDLLRELTALNFVVDPVSSDALSVGFDLKRKDATVRSLLDDLCAAADLDYDWRYGVLWLGMPKRLWERVPPLPESASKKLRESLADFEKKSLKVESLKGRKLTEPEDEELRVLQREWEAQSTRVQNEIYKYAHAGDVFPILESFSASGSPSVAQLCRECASSRRKDRWGVSAFPRGNWGLMEARGAASAVADRIQRIKIDLEFDGSPFRDVLAFLRDFADLNILDLTGRELKPVDLKAKDVTLADAFAMLTLPRGVGLEIRNGAVSLTDPAKPRGPRVNRWKNQDLAGDDEWIAWRIEGSTLDLAFDEPTPLRDVLGFLGEFCGCKFELADGTPEPSIRIQVHKMPLEHILAWITLPYGLDAKIQKGAIVVFEREKK